MRCIINDLEYNTEKMGLLFKAETSILNPILTNMFGRDMYYTYDCDVYVSKNGSYCIVYQNSYNKYMKAINENEAKELMKKYNYDLYCLIFGKLKEA